MRSVLVPYHQDERLPDGDIPLPWPVETVDVALSGDDVWARLVTLYEAVADRVAAGANVVVSGDCLVAAGTVAGVQRAGLDPSVVWFDAHGDVHTLQTSTSGYLGGLALRLVLGAHRELVADPLGLRPVPERHAVLVDSRDLDAAEVEYLAGSDVARVAVGDVQEPVLPDGPLVLHVDLDVIDGGELPGLRFPAPGGPTTRVVLDAVRRVLATERVAAVSIACPWFPARDDGETRIRAGLLSELVASME